MDQEEMGRILSGIIRVGIVTSVDEKRRTARVKFQGEKLPSGPLHILAARPYVPDDKTDPQKTEPLKGGDRHVHELKIKPWLPKVNAAVLCVYLPVFSGDGFMLGEIGGEEEIRQ